MTADRISTGVAAFDDQLGGGIPTSSVVAITTPPAAPIGLLLVKLVGSEDLDSVTYVTADRRPAAIRRQLYGATTDPDTDAATSDVDRPTEQFELIDARSNGVRTFGKTVEGLPTPANRATATPKEAAGETQERAAASEAPADEPTSQTTTRVTADPTASSAEATSDTGAVDALVVDTLTGLLDGSPGQWNDHFDALVKWVHEAAEVAYLVLRRPPGRPPSAAESHVLYRADAVFEYQRGEAGADDELVVTKIRDGSRPTDPIPLDVTDTLGINPDRRV